MTLRRHWCWGLLMPAMAAGLLLAGRPAAAQEAPPGKTPVYVEDSPAAADLVKQAQQFARQHRLADAVALYQQAIEQYPHKLMPAAEDGLFADVLEAANATLAGDKELLEAYRRQYEPAAQRALEQACVPVASAAALEAVTARYRLCAAGLEASLRLAALWLEQAQPTSAARVLDGVADHPDLAAQGGRWHLLQAAAGLYANQPERLETHRKALAEAHDTARAALVQSWVERLQRPVLPRPLDAMAPLPAAALPERMQMPLWQVHMPTATGSDGTDTLVRTPGAYPAAQALPVLHALPLAVDDRLYVCDGGSVLALDRISGRPLWTYLVPNALLEDGSPNPLQRLDSSIPDLRGVASDGRRLLAIVGRAPSWPVSWQGKVNNTALVALDAADGRLLWRIEPGDLDPGLAPAFFHGTPIAGNGLIYVPLRRIQLSGFEDAFLVALDSGTGKPVWRRHLSSTVAANRYTTRTLSQVLYHEDRLFISDNLGAVTCLDGRTGTVVWLRTIGDVIDGSTIARLSAGRGTPPWQVTAPILVKAGLVIGPLAPATPALLLDPATGRKLRELKEDGFADAAYLMPTALPGAAVGGAGAAGGASGGAAGGDILSFGPKVRLYDGATLKQKWVQTLAPNPETTPYGRAAVTGQHVLVPLPDALVVLSLANGAMVSHTSFTCPGNVLALDGEVVLADGETVRGMMTWDWAAAALRRRIAARPRDPAPALALAHLAHGAGQTEVLLAALDEALAALQRRAQAAGDSAADDPACAGLQDLVFQQVLRLVDARRTPDAALRRQLFDRLARATRGPAGEVEYLLTFSAFLTETGRPAEAVGHYQDVLQDAALAAQLYQGPEGSRRAGLEAQLRLAAVVRQAGPAVYARYETIAAQRLEELSHGDTATPAQFVELARQYPLARSAPAALVAAGQALLARGDRAAGLDQLRRAYQQTTDRALLARIVGALAQAYESADQPWRARQWLQRARREHPDVQPLRRGQPVSVDTWLADLSSQPHADGLLPALGLPAGKPLVLPGHLLAPALQPAATWPHDRVALQDGRKVQMRAGPRLEAAWELEAPDTGTVLLLSLTPRQALFWIETGAQLVAVDSASGQVQWRAAEVQGLLREAEQAPGDGPAGAAAPARDGAMLEGLQALLALRDGAAVVPPQRLAVRLPGAALRLAMPGAVEADDAAGPPLGLMAANDAVLCLADRLGRAVGIDRRTGKVLWRMRTGLDRIDLVQMSDDALALSGAAGGAAGDPLGAILVLDPLTGEPRFPILDDKDTPQWLSLGGDGLVLYAASGRLAAYSSDDGRPVWRTTVRGQPLGPAVRTGEEALLVIDRTGALVALDPATGQLAGRLEGLGSCAGQAVRLDVADQQCHVLTSTHALAVGPQGKVMWRDAIAATGQTMVLQALSAKYVALVTQAAPPAAPDAEALAGPNPPNPAGNEPLAADASGARTYQLYVLDRWTGGLVARRTLGPISEPLDPSQVVVLDGRLLLCTSSMTLAIPGK